MRNIENYQFFHKKGTLKTEVSNFTVVVLNQSPISAVPLIVRCPREKKNALMGDLLYLKNHEDMQMYKTSMLYKCLRVKNFINDNQPKPAIKLHIRLAGLTNFFSFLG